MYRVDNSTSASVKPTRGAEGPNKDGYYQDETIVEHDHLNAMQDEISAVVESSGIELDKDDDTQLSQALPILGGDLYGVTEFESADQSVPAENTDLVVAHGLGASPKFSSVVLKCITSESGWDVNDEVQLTNDNGDSGRHVSTWTSSLNVGIRWSDGIRLIDRDTGTAFFDITPANWKIVFRAWK